MVGIQPVKTPVVLQMEAVECGAASLGMILAYYKRNIPLEELRRLCNVGRNGSNAHSIFLAAQAQGMTAEGYSYTPEELKAVQPPAILHWGFNHFVVYEGYDEKTNRVLLNDPAFGHRTVSWEEFEGEFTGVCLICRPGEGFCPLDATPKIWKELLSELLLSKNTLYFVLCVAGSLAIVNLCQPVTSQVFFDKILTYKHRDWLHEILLALSVIFVLKAGLLFLRSWCLIRWQTLLSIEKSTAFLEHLLHLPISFFQERYAGEVTSRLQFNEAVTNFVTGRLAVVVIDFLVALVYLALLFLYNSALTLIAIVFTALNLALNYYAYAWLQEQQLKIQQDGGRLFGLTASGIATIESLKANGNERDFFLNWASYQSKFISLLQDTERVSAYLSFVAVLLSAINSTFIMAIGGFEIMDGFMTVGVFIAFQSLMERFQTPITNIVNMSQEIQQTKSQMTRIEDVLNAEPEPPVVVSGNYKIPARLSGDVEFRDVFFNYSKIERPLIRKLRLHITPGKRLAVIGASGSGKSTVASLLMGFQEPWSGKILFDGIPRNEIPKEVLANSIAVVEQETYLFDGTIAENISLFDPTIPRQDIIQAAKDACIHETISLLSDGYDARVKEGGKNFSGGERQRIEIARALAGNPTLLIFDEATSALDPITEKNIMQNIRRRGCACLLIAHRLSTIRDCDEIIVLERGRVVQRGTHHDMAYIQGPYRKLMKG